jgi:hypothetical protein
MQTAPQRRLCECAACLEANPGWWRAEEWVSPIFAPRPGYVSKRPALFVVSLGERREGIRYVHRGITLSAVRQVGVVLR